MGLPSRRVATDEVIGAVRLVLCEATGGIQPKSKSAQPLLKEKAEQLVHGKLLVCLGSWQCPDLLLLGT